MGQGKENRGRSVKGICNLKWHTLRKGICDERCGEYCRRGSGCVSNPNLYLRYNKILINVIY